MSNEDSSSLEQRLLTCGPASASEWFAVPLTAQQALVLQAKAHLALQRAYSADGESFAGRLMELVSGFWLEKPTETRFGVLRPNLDGWHRAVLDLVYGQLLISRRQHNAMSYLDAGFAAAGGFLAPSAYFAVMNRHELLRRLPLFAEPRSVRTLDELLAEARVIKQLRGNAGIGGNSREDKTDTIS